jgi:NitT/TauT family transport system substrate-binding protein
MTRRRALGACGATAAAPLLQLGTAGWAEDAATTERPLARLTLWGSPAGPSITLAHAVVARMLREVADKAEFRAWRNPDEMRAGLASGTMQAVVVPTQVAANLFTGGSACAWLAS